MHIDTSKSSDTLHDIEDDLRGMADALLFPDVVVNFTLTLEVGLRRLLQPQLRRYQQHRARVRYQSAWDTCGSGTEMMDVG
jgi:hypothetical protein